MDDAPFWLREWHGQTTIHPLGLAALGVTVILVLSLPRRYMLWPVIAIGCFVATAQRIVVFNMDWTLLRLTLLAAALRCVMLYASPSTRPRWRPIDTWLALWLACGVAFYVLREPSMSALNNRLGWAFDYAAGYAVVRFAVRTWDDLKSLCLAVTAIAVPVSLAFINEHMTRYNIFHIFGGVREITWIRDGRLRCQGAFAHPILAGTYWAVLLPLIASQFWAREKTRRLLAALGVACAVIVVATCSSSTPVMSVLMGAFAGGMVLLRHWLRWILLGFACLLVFLHLSMQAPVWHLISRIDIVGGSTGWHRYNLFDQWIRNFDNWALMGTSSTHTWDARPVTDITNQYVLEAIRGGLLTLIMFIGMITATFMAVGRAAKATDRAGMKPEFAMVWAIGAAMFVHVVTFFGVSYFGQIILLLVAVPALAACVDELTSHRGRAAAIGARTRMSPHAAHARRA
ncbi:MAG: hypothetical protein EA379_12460 [Phycisphaerales bacterium]|nr:MAG: hypothetical protein EA379_12460 [Phycisphaerales bacterium]